MNIRFWVVTVTLTPLLLLSSAASSLSMEQFTAICQSQKRACHTYPILQAYVGGALDLIAMLDEETDYLAKVYCKKPAELFDVPKIIRFMEEHQEAYATRNAMLLVIRYLEEKGGCLKP